MRADEYAYRESEGIRVIAYKSEPAHPVLLKETLPSLSRLYTGGDMAKVSDIIKGLQLLSKYADDGEETHLGGADHDIIYSHVGGDTVVAPEDIVSLEKLGWHWDDDVDCWANFV